MKLSKCHFFMKKIQYLEHILSTKGIRPPPSKTQVIKTCIHQKMPKQVHAFLGLVGYYRKFIRNFAKIAKLLTLLTHQQAKFKWTPTHHNAFLTLQGISHPSTNIMLPKSKEMLHSLYRCIRWCLWSTAVSGTWWNRIPNNFPFKYIHWHTMEMEHPQNKRPMEYIKQSQNGTTTFREQKS